MRLEGTVIIINPTQDSRTFLYVHGCFLFCQSKNKKDIHDDQS